MNNMLISKPIKGKNIFCTNNTYKNMYKYYKSVYDDILNNINPKDLKPCILEIYKYILNKVPKLLLKLHK